MERGIAVEDPLVFHVSALSSSELDEELDPDPGPTTCSCFFSPSVDRGVPVRLLAQTSELSERGRGDQPQGSVATRAWESR